MFEYLVFYSDQYFNTEIHFRVFLSTWEHKENTLTNSSEKPKFYVVKRLQNVTFHSNMNKCIKTFVYKTRNTKKNCQERDRSSGVFSLIILTVKPSLTVATYPEYV